MGMAQRSFSGKIGNNFLVHPPRIGSILTHRIGIENFFYRVPDEPAHLRPSDAVHFEGIDSRWNSHRMRTGKNSPSSVNSFTRCMVKTKCVSLSRCMAAMGSGPGYDGQVDAAIGAQAFPKSILGMRTVIRGVCPKLRAI
jgi:hypothetical protein